MARQRWGSFSVRDHLNTRALATDVLLYDQLVFPAPPEGDEKAEQLWHDNRWDLEFLKSRLHQLGPELSRTYDWGLEQHETFKKRFPRLKAQFDLENMAKAARGELPYWETRMMIATDHANIVPKGLDADVVAAYQTKRAFSTDFILKEQRERDVQLGYLISFMIHVPATGNEDANLETAIGIARDTNFHRKRRDLYAWQQGVVGEGKGIKADLQKFLDLVETYNAEVREHCKKTRRRYTYTLLTAGLGVAEAAFGNVIGAGSAFVGALGLATSDEAVPAVRGPTAMFHHVDQVFGRP